MKMTWTQLKAYMNIYTSLQQLPSITNLRVPLVIFFLLLFSFSIC